MGVIDGCGVGWWVDGVAVSVAAAAAAAAVGLCLVALGGPALQFVAVRTAHPTRSRANQSNRARMQVPVVGTEERGGSLVYGSTASHNFIEGCQCTKQTLPSNADVQSKRRTSDVFAVGTLMIRRMRWRNMCDSGSLGVSPPDADLSVCIHAL